MNYLSNTRTISLLIISFTGFYAPYALSHGDSHESSDPRGIIEIEWLPEQIDRTLTAGYPESFELASFFRRSPSQVTQVDGLNCVTSNFLSFDVADDFAYDIDETIHLDLLIHQSKTSTLLYGYDRSGPGNMTGEIAIKPKKNRIFSA